MYNSSKTISVQEVNNHDWFFYKLYGESLNNGSIFLNSKQYFHLWNLYRLSNADDASFTFRVMLFQFRATCARVQPVYLWIQARAARCISQMLPDKKKSIICQQVQHNFEQYITTLKKKLKLGQQEKNNYFSLKCAKSTEIWAYICWYRSRLRYEFVRGRLFTPFVTHQVCGWLNTSK